MSEDYWIIRTSVWIEFGGVVPVFRVVVDVVDCANDDASFWDLVTTGEDQIDLCSPTRLI